MKETWLRIVAGEKEIDILKVCFGCSFKTLVRGTMEQRICHRFLASYMMKVNFYFLN